jgi:glycosyltransferase involved in cell wall biosynthesis
LRIIECHFEFSGFSDRLVKAGTSVYLWNLARHLRAIGHRVTGLTAAHGLLPELSDVHVVSTLDWRSTVDIPVRLDPVVWPGFPDEVTISVTATAHRIVIDDIEIIMLSGGPLDTYTESFYPPRDLEGRDLSFLKPLVFQVVAARYLADNAAAGTVVHLHEPFYHYLLPALLAGRGLHVVSTVQTNLPVNTKVYGPEVRAILRHMAADASVTEGLADPPLDTPLQQAMRSYLPLTRLYHDYPQRPGHDYITMLGLVIRSVAAMDFLSDGQREHALTQAGTPFEQLFAQLAVHRELRARADRLVVGGCAIGDEWLDVKRDSQRRERTLTSLGLDPALPTVFHNARYSVQHKGQKEVFKAVRRLLDEGVRCNVLLHCLSPEPPDDPDLDDLSRLHPSVVCVRTGPMTSEELMDWAASSDFCVFPSKFEMDTFLMAMGEAMASGAIPIATAQRGMRHFNHSFDLDDPGATGLAVPRSFRVDDPALTEAVYLGLRRLLELNRRDPERVESLRARAVAVSRQFNWAGVAGRFAAVFAACAAGEPPASVLPEPPRMAGAGPDAGPADPGRGRARRGAGGIDLRWECAGAERVEAVLPGRPPMVRALDPGPDGSFHVTLPASPNDAVAVLVTLPGAAVWAAAAVGVAASSTVSRPASA